MDPETNSVNVSLTNVASKAVIKLTTGYIVLNETSWLLIMVPGTKEAGEYELSVATQLSVGSNLLEQARTTS